jgi:cell surface protein SprA
MNGKVGDKVNLNLNYNTDATFDFDAQNMKLKYDGKEDEIIKLVEAGNVSFPSNSSLIQGCQLSLWYPHRHAVRQAEVAVVASQKKSTSSSVSSQRAASS